MTKMIEGEIIEGARKVLFVLPNLNGGGAERVFVHLVNHIDRERFEPHLALGVAAGPYLSDIANDVEIHELGSERARSVVPALIRCVKRVRPATVISTLGMNFANAIGSKFYPIGTRVILREGNSASAFLSDVGRQNRLLRASYILAYRRLYNRTDTIICQSDFMVDDLASNLRVDRHRLVRIHNPVDVARIELLASQTNSDILASDSFNFVSVGKFQYQKGYDVLLQAFAEAYSKNARFRLTIFGDGDERQELERLRHQLGLDGVVSMPGFVANPYSHISSSDVFVSSSRYEGFANVIVESLALGVPVVATDCPSANREVIRENFNGWISATENVDELAKTMIRAFATVGELDRRAIAEDCRERFSISTILKDYESIIAGPN